MSRPKEHRFTVRLEISLYDELRLIAFNERKTINQTVMEMLESSIRRFDQLSANKTADASADVGIYANSEMDFCPELPTIVTSYRDLGLIAVIKTLQLNSDYILIFNFGISDGLRNKHTGKEPLILLEWPTNIITAPNSYWRYVVALGMQLWWSSGEVKDGMNATFEQWVRR